MKRLTLLFVVALTIFAVGVAHAVTIDLVPVGNANNLPDTRYNSISVGAVAKEYAIGKYEVTAGQYTEFLNAVGKTDTYGLYNTSMYSSSYGCKIQQTPVSGGYTYSVTPGYEDRPVNYVSFWDAARFTNWLHNGQKTIDQDPNVTEYGAYTLNGYNGLDGRTIAKNDAAQWWIPSEDQWYKAAYHKNDGATGNYWDYPTKTALGSPPGRDMTEARNPGNNANIYGSGPYPIDGTHYTTVKGEFELSDSAYHTFDQGGNVVEWNDTVVSQGTGWSVRGSRGGCFTDYANSLPASVRIHYNPTYEIFGIGFRVATNVPEPSSITLLVAGAIAAMIWWRRCK